MKSSLRRFPEWQHDAVPEEAHVPMGVRVAENGTGSRCARLI